MKPSVFHNNYMEQTEIKCREFHGINGKMPMAHELQFDEQTCDCGKIIFYKEKCNCPNNPHYDLKSKPNPNYTG